MDSGQIPGALFNNGVFGAGAVGGGSINNGTIVVSTPFSITQTWNDVTQQFKAFVIDITDTNSLGTSLLADFRIGGTSHYAFGKNTGVPFYVGTNTSAGQRGFYLPTGADASIWGFHNNIAYWGFGFADTSFRLQSGVPFGWSSGNPAVAVNDTGFARKAAKIVEINSGVAGTYPGTALSTGVQTVAQLPAAATAGAGARSMVSDANSVVFNAAAVGGGANIMPVFCNGVGWFIG